MIIHPKETGLINIILKASFRAISVTTSIHLLTPLTKTYVMADIVNGNLESYVQTLMDPNLFMVTSTLGTFASYSAYKKNRGIGHKSDYPNVPPI